MIHAHAFGDKNGHGRGVARRLEDRPRTSVDLDLPPSCFDNGPEVRQDPANGIGDGEVRHVSDRPGATGMRIDLFGGPWLVRHFSH